MHTLLVLDFVSIWKCTQSKMPTATRIQHPAMSRMKTLVQTSLKCFSFSVLKPLCAEEAMHPLFYKDDFLTYIARMQNVPIRPAVLFLWFMH